MAGEDIVLKSEGTQFYSYCYVTDVVRALLFLLLREENGQCYNITNPDSDIRLRDLAAFLAKKAGKSVVFKLPDGQERKGYSTATKALLDAEKLRSLGWQAKYGIEAGLARTVKILREQE